MHVKEVSKDRPEKCLPPYPCCNHGAAAGAHRRAASRFREVVPQEVRRLVGVGVPPVVALEARVFVEMVALQCTTQVSRLHDPAYCLQDPVRAVQKMHHVVGPSVSLFHPASETIQCIERQTCIWPRTQSKPRCMWQLYSKSMNWMLSVGSCPASLLMSACDAADSPCSVDPT